MVYLKLKGKKMKKYILLERSYSTGSFGRHLNYHRGWFCEEKAKQRIQGVEFSTKQALTDEVINAISDIATIAHEAKMAQEFRNQLKAICAEEFEKFAKKPNLTNIKKMIKNVLSKIEKKELKNKIIESKIYRIKKAMEVIK